MFPVLKINALFGDSAYSAKVAQRSLRILKMLIKGKHFVIFNGTSQTNQACRIGATRTTRIPEKNNRKEFNIGTRECYNPKRITKDSRYLDLLLFGT